MVVPCGGIRSARWLGGIGAFVRVRTGSVGSVGLHLGAAREKVRVARALEALPNTSQAFAAGLLSYSKARAITRVGTPENEEYLLMIAHHGTATHLEKVVRHYRRVKRWEELDRVNDQYAARESVLPLRRRRFLDHPGGGYRRKWGRRFVNALEARSWEADIKKNVPAGTSGADSATTEFTPIGAERADALCKMAESYLANERTRPAGWG